jgi:hypothetical protein
MRSTAWTPIGVLFLVGGFAVAAAPERQASVAQLAWLAGCWAYEGAEPGSGETWMPPAGGVLLGVARTLQGGRVASYEFQRIVDAGEGEIEFVSQPSGGPEVRFRLKSLAANEAAFENLDNDFPQRVIYRLAQSGNISARIEGAKDGATRVIDLPMRRTSCELTPSR